MTPEPAETNGMEGKVCLVTGATSGIGLVTAQTLAKRGSRLLIVGRDPRRVETALASLGAAPANGAHLGLLADLSRPDEVKRLVDQVCNCTPKLDVLINNVGAMFLTRQSTAEGLERTFALNHLSYFTLTNLLLGMLEASAPARIVNVSSEAHRGSKGINFDDPQLTTRYGGWRAYCQSKLANVLFTNELARRLTGRNVSANSLHPGFVRSHFFEKPGFRWWVMRQSARLFAISPEQGAATSLYLACAPEMREVTGKYFYKCEPVDPSSASKDRAAAQRLWNLSSELTGVGR